jgi:hypothetical protein
MHETGIHIIDIVTKNHFKEFFDEVEVFHNELVSTISCLEFPSAFVSAAFRNNEQVLNSVDEDGMLTMMHTKREQGRKSRGSKIELKSKVLRSLEE